MAFAASIQLQQLKLYTGPAPKTDRFVVQEQALVAAPARLANCFIIAPATGIDLERLVRVATYSDIVDDVTYPVNPLNAFVAVNTTVLNLAQALDELRIYNAPGEWGSIDGGTDATGDYKTFTIASVVSGRVQITGRFWSKFTSSTLVTYSVYRAGVQVTSGVDGQIQRADPTKTIFKDSQFMAPYYLPADALDHMTYVQTYVQSLAKAASLTPAEFLAFTPGNPVTNTYNE